MITMYVDKVLANMGEVKTEELKSTVDTQALQLQTLQDFQRQMVTGQLLQGTLQGHTVGTLQGHTVGTLQGHTVQVAQEAAQSPPVTSQAAKSPTAVKKEEKTHICIDCGKTFGRKDHLTRHHLIHSGITFPCDICNSRFSRKDKVKDHMLKVHHPERCEKPYNCVHCGKLFGRKDHLRRHSATHLPGRGGLVGASSGVCGLPAVTTTTTTSNTGVSFAGL